MKNLVTYYVVDTLTESIVTSFEAISNDMAKYILKRLLNENEKVKAIGSYLKLYYGSMRCVCETFSEVSEQMDHVLDFDIDVAEVK